MRFELDENLPVEAAVLLRSAGHDAMTVLEQSMGGELDPQLALVCQEEDRALVTLDTDFADIRTYPPEAHPGLVVLRLQRQDKPYVLNMIARLIPLLAANVLTGRLWIVDENRVRVR